MPEVFWNRAQSTLFGNGGERHGAQRRLKRRGRRLPDGGEFGRPGGDARLLHQQEEVEERAAILQTDSGVVQQMEFVDERRDGLTLRAVAAVGLIGAFQPGPQGTQMRSL